MKKIFSLLLSLICLTFIGCGAPSSGLAATPGEEYARIANLNGTNKLFDLDALSTFEVSQTTEIRSDSILEKNQNKPINESISFKMDIIDIGKERSYSECIKLNGINVLDASFSVTPIQKSMYLNGYLYPGNNKVNSYSEYLSKVTSSCDAVYRRNLKLPPVEIFSSLIGDKTGGKYFIKGMVEDSKKIEMLEWWSNFFPFFGIKDSANEFLYLDMTKEENVGEISLSLQTNKNQLLSLEVSIKALGKQVIGEMTIISQSSFKTAGVSVPLEWKN